MRDDIGSIVISLVVLLVVAIARPRSAACPKAYWLDEGVRADGRYRCACMTPEQWDAAGELEPFAIDGRVYCEQGVRAVTNDGVTVVCAIGGLL